MWKVVNLLFRFPLHFAYTRIHLKPRKRCNLGQKILDVRERVKSKQRRAIAQGKSGSAKAAKKRASNAYPEITFPSDFRDPDRANHADCSHATVTTPGCSTFSVTSFPPPFQKKPCPRRGKIRQKERKKEKTREKDGEERSKATVNFNFEKENTPRMETSCYFLITLASRRPTKSDYLLGKFYSKWKKEVTIRNDFESLFQLWNDLIKI